MQYENQSSFILMYLIEYCQIFATVYLEIIWRNELRHISFDAVQFYGAWKAPIWDKTAELL